MRYFGEGIAGAGRSKTFRSCYAERPFHAAMQKIDPRQSNVSGTESSAKVQDGAFSACGAHLNEGVQNLKHARRRAPILHLTAPQNSFISVTSI
ncbi:hypothetical protein MKD50_20320 [Cupriavidus sp. WGtm5]|uniref:hypothetical protein n=1 Tax=Cupriavidus sp. WGtm5 TaxID=2919926 RepID=UPI0020915AFB|nr:hypothetical protein [Cupriavidus sp. WGtm5]MCO4891734.1 hypothetical protein [Cupriavidus sp. WGtm5]